MKRIFVVAIFIVLVVCVRAQTSGFVRVTGSVVTADGRCAENVNVVLKGTGYGAVTDVHGNFAFSAPAGCYTLVVFSIVHHRVERPVTIRANGENRFPDIKIMETAMELGEVVVTGTRTEKRLLQSPVQTVVIGQRDVKKAAAVSVLEALMDNIPGIVVTPNAMGNNMRIRGLNSRYILLLVDGERLVSEGAGGNINLDQLAVGEVKRVEIINGAASALYGSNAVGAVINIITKDAIHGGEVGANVVAESYNTWKMEALAAMKFNRVSARVSGFRNSSDGFGGDGESPYSAKYEDWGGSVKVGYRAGERLGFNLNGRYFRHETFNSGGALNVVHPLTHTFSLGAGAEYASADMRNRLRLSTNFNEYLDMKVFEQKNNESQKNNSASYWANRLLHTFSANEMWEFVSGLEHNHEQTFATKTLGSVPTTKTLDDINLFGQVDCKPIKDLNVVAGVRYTYNTQFKSAVNPKLSLMYKLGNFRLRAGTGTAFRTPSIKELYYNFDHQGMFWVYGNPNLKAEKGLYNSLSVEYFDNMFNGSVSVYLNSINEKISQYEVIGASGQKELYYKNVSSATLKGVDVSLSMLVLKELLFKVNYSYCDAKENSTKLQIPGNVKHSSTISATWSGKIRRSPFSLQLSGRLNSPKIYQMVETDSFGKEVTNTVCSKSYSIWKLVLVKPFYISNHLIEISAKVDNIFNFKEASFINPGRQYLLGLRYSFKNF